MKNIKEPKTPKKFPYVLREDQVQQLLEIAKKRARTWTGIRDYTIIMLLIEVGLRLTEVISAKLENLNLPRKSLKVEGKGAKERKVFFWREDKKAATNLAKDTGGYRKRNKDRYYFYQDKGSKFLILLF